MALFRNVTRLLHFQQLSELSGAKASPLFIVPLKSGVLPYASRAPWRAITTTPGYPGLTPLDCSMRCRRTPVSPFSTSYKWLHTQCGGFLAPKAEKKATKKPQKKGTQEHGSVLNELMSVKTEDQPTQLTVGAKVVQAGRDFSYLLVVLGGFAVAGFLLWSVGSEFFSSNSSQSIYAKALKRVKQDPQVVETLGEPISGHGELSGRGRRREPMHLEYEVEGVSYMRMKFYLKGAQRKGTVHLDMKKNEQGKYELRFLFVELDGRPHRTIVLEDNR
jgi:import inner membrane translocase subunit TIM21